MNTTVKQIAMTQPQNARPTHPIPMVIVCSYTKTGIIHKTPIIAAVGIAVSEISI